MIKKLKYCLVLFIIILFINNVSISIKAYPTKITPTSSITKRTARINDKITYSIGDISFENNTVYEIRSSTYFAFKEVVNSVDTTNQLDSIVIPRMSATSKGRPCGVQVALSRISGIGGRIKKFDFTLQDNIQSYTFTRAELMQLTDTSTLGEIFISFYPLDENNEQHDFGDYNTFSSLTQEGKIDFNYTVIDDGKPYQDRTYQLNQTKFRARYVPTTGIFEETVLGGYPYFETSDISVESSKTNNITPGDIIELTFTINNPSNYHNSTIWISFDAPGLELYNQTSSVTSFDNSWLPFTLSDWRIGENAHYLPLFKTVWLKVNSKKTYTITQSFKVKDDFTLNNIKIKPNLYIHNDYNNREYNKTSIIKIGKSNLSFNVNGGNGTMNPLQLEYLEATTLPNNTTSKEGYSFLGWASSLEDANDSTVTYLDNATYIHEAQSNQVLYAVWKKNDDTFKMIYHKNKATSGQVPIDNKIYNSPNDIVILGQATLKKDGYTFKGWNTKPDGTGTTYQEGSKYGSLASKNTNNIDINLYALWKIKTIGGDDATDKDKDDISDKDYPKPPKTGMNKEYVFISLSLLTGLIVLYRKNIKF